jgi:O-antigen/teichoic acid export membrane protein
LAGAEAVTDVRKSYLSNYLKVYLWQCLSIATSFLSMFVVMPQLSSRPSMFGIYSICLSITIFVSYADFGFMNSGFRYASESFVKGDLNTEVRVVGFVSFILLAFVMLHAAVVSVFAIHPTLLIANLTDPRESWTASMLLALLAVFSPVIVLQRMLQIVFGVRIEDYIYQRINIAGNLAKVASVFLFFSAAGYNIVGYFFTCQVIGLLCCVVSLIIAQRRYHYDLSLLLRSVRFSRAIYDATKRLAFSSLYVTIAWVAFYEFDTLFIGKTLGAEKLAFYSVALALTTFFRTLSSIIFAPFRARMNHFVALKDDVRLRELYRRVMVVTMPASIFPVISLIVLMKPFVFCWVGGNYLPSVLIAQMLIVAYIDGFSINPAVYLLTAQERVLELNVIGSLSPIILWGGVLLTIHLLDVTTFGFLKFVAALPVQVFGLVISVRCLKMGGAEFFKRVASPAILPSVCLIVLLSYLKGFMPIEKSQVNVAVVVATGGLASALSLLIYYWRSSEFRAEVTNVAGWGSFRRKAAVEGV